VPEQAHPPKAAAPKRAAAEPRAERPAAVPASAPALALALGAAPAFRRCAVCGGGSASGQVCPSCAGSAAQFAAAAPRRGTPLPRTVRTDLEPRFGVPLGNVRIHTDTLAENAAAELDARAFAFGPHLAFARGQFDPATGGGRKLLAHEIAHTLQPAAPAGGPLTVGARGDRFEQDAHATATRALHSAGPPAPARPPGTRAAIQRYSFDEFLDDAGSAASSGYNSARSAVSAVADAGGRVVQGVVETGEHVVQGVADAAGEVGSAVVSAGQTVVAAAESAVDQARSAVEAAWQTATGVAREAWGAIRAAGSWVYGKGAAFASWLGGKLMGIVSWLGSLLGLRISPVGSGVQIDFPDYEVFPREEHIPLPIQVPELVKTFRIGAIEFPIGPVIVGAELDAKLSLAATSAANLGPVMLRHISLLLDPFASHYRGTGEIDAVAEAAVQVVGTGTLLGEIDIGAIIYGVPVIVPTIGIEGGIRLTGVGTLGGDLTNAVTLDYAAGRFTFGDTASLALGLLLEADADAILGITFAEKDVCSWAWHIGRLAWGRAARGSLDLELAAGGSGGRTRRLTGRIDEIPVEDVVRGVFDLHPEPNCPGLGAILDALGIDKTTGPLGPLGITPAGGTGGTGPFDIEWPVPTWRTAGHGDSGVSGGTQRPPKTIFRKKPSPPRDRSVIENYIAKNRGVYKPTYQVHHKWPLFVSGPDAEANLVFLTVNEHRLWHEDLYYQKHGYLPSDPNKTEYHIVKYK
jgi:hypothetical protein